MKNSAISSIILCHTEPLSPFLSAVFTYEENSGNKIGCLTALYSTTSALQISDGSIIFQQ